MHIESPLFFLDQLKCVSAPHLTLDRDLQLIIPAEKNIKDYKDLEDVPLTIRIAPFAGGEVHGLEATIQGSFLNLTREQQVELYRILETQKAMAKARVDVTISAINGEQHKQIDRILSSFKLSY
jgi:coenzyme F420-reducing hydrogenase alpha subunit